MVPVGGAPVGGPVGGAPVGPVPGNSVDEVGPDDGFTVLTHLSSGMYPTTHLPLTRFIPEGQSQSSLLQPGNLGQSD